MNRRVFKYSEKFKDTVVYAILGAFVILCLAGIISSVMVGQVQLEKIGVYLLVIGVAIGAFVWFRKLELNVEVTDEMVSFQMLPLHKSAHRILWKDVVSCDVIKTPKYAQWHGSNLNFGNPRWFSLSGKNGLSIVTKDGKTFFIGCNDVALLSEFLIAKNVKQIDGHDFFEDAIGEAV